MISDVGFVLRNVTLCNSSGSSETDALDCKISQSILHRISIMAFDTKIKGELLNQLFFFFYKL